jgi:outer membrane protein OmpA-like peptidoglycan-associated protein
MFQISMRRGRVVLWAMVLAGLAAGLVDGIAQNQPQQGGAAPAFESYSRFDFVAGEKVIAFEDFSQDSIGDFPASWNTNASGEIVTIANRTGRWLKLTGAGVFVPDFPALADNFTLEFDLLVAPKFDSGYRLNTAIVELEDLKAPAAWQVADNRFHFNVLPAKPESSTQMEPRQDGVGVALVGAEIKGFGPDGVPVHVSVWRQRQRVRVYFNENKVWDVPRALSPKAKYNAIVFFVPGVDAGSEYYLANIRLAAGAPDTRNKLLTEGKWVTHGILFDVNSDKVKPESYGAIKEISNVLGENADVKVQIIGHTDSDGDEAQNLDLSKRRAEAVRAVLIAQFKIDGSRLTTDGKGETQPIDRNDTAAGKANNRRVEFVRM